MPTIQELLSKNLEDHDDVRSISDPVKCTVANVSPVKHVGAKNTELVETVLKGGDYEIRCAFIGSGAADVNQGEHLVIHPNKKGEGINLKGPYKGKGDNEMSVLVFKANIDVESTPSSEPARSEPTLEEPAQREARPSTGIKSDLAKNANSMILGMIATKAMIEPAWLDLRGKAMSDEEFWKVAVSLMIQTRPIVGSLPTARIEIPDDLKAKSPEPVQEAEPVTEEPAQPEEDDDVPF